MAAQLKMAVSLAWVQRFLDDAIIGENCVVAAGSLVPPRKEYPAGSMIMGNPAKVVRQLTEKEAKFAANHFQSYLGYKEQFQNDFSYNQDLKEQGLVKL
jgi:carbonic anhydrase/acetyltransferase-like protein (isoleucine patch superfamily)